MPKGFLPLYSHIISANFENLLRNTAPINRKLGLLTLCLLFYLQ